MACDVTEADFWSDPLAPDADVDFLVAPRDLANVTAFLDGNRIPSEVR